MTTVELVPPESDTLLALPTVLESHATVDPVAAYLAGLAPKSRQVVRERLLAVARVIGLDPAAVPWHDLRVHHVEYIRGRLLELGRAPATVNLTLAALRGVLKQARNQHLLDDEEYRRITEVKPARGSRLPAGRDIAAGELRAMAEACARDRTTAGARDLAALAILYIGGLRRSELVQLDTADYRPEPPTLRVRHGKGNKERLVPLTGTAAAALQAWLTLRGDRPGRLFLPVSQTGAVTGETISSIAIYNLLQKRAKQAGVPHLSPHDFRRTFVGDLLDAGVDLSAAQQLAGHASVVTTARYDRRGESAKRRSVERLHFPLPSS